MVYGTQVAANCSNKFNEANVYVELDMCALVSGSSFNYIRVGVETRVDASEL